MRVPRVFQNIPLSIGAVLELAPESANYLLRVLRLRPGASLILFNGEGGEYQAVLEETGRRTATARVVDFAPTEAESPLAITLVQGISRGERMDFTVQKAVELGVTRIVPVIAERTVVNLKGERRERRREHWQAVAVSACEQCGRNRVPMVDEPIDLRAWLEREVDGLRLMLDPGASDGFSALVASRSLTLLIGPEGGFSEQEIALAAERGYRGLRLGPRVLRTETAGIVALAALQLRFGDLG